MQSTIDEHAASPFADRTCASCHFPVGPSGRGHDLRSTRDDEAWRRALEVRASRVEQGVRLRLTPRGVGHAFPTGDLFRRLELRAELVADGEVIERYTRHLARHFEPWRHPDGMRNDAYAWPVRDDRVRGPTEVTLPLDRLSTAPREAEVVWHVSYQRVDARDEQAPETSSIASEIRLASGRL